MILNILQLYDHYEIVYRPVEVVVKDIAIGAVGLGFDYRAVQIEYSVAYGLPPLRRFFGAVSPRR